MQEHEAGGDRRRMQEVKTGAGGGFQESNPFPRRVIQGEKHEKCH